MEIIKEVFEVIAKVIDIIGVAILVFGFAKQLVKYFSVEFLHNPMKTQIIDLQRIRCQLGVYILFALDFLIASDIIHTVLEVTQEQLLELFIMIVLRTGIGHFLGKEIEEIRKIESIDIQEKS